VCASCSCPILAVPPGGARRTTSNPCFEGDYVGSPQSAKFTEIMPVTETVLPFWSVP
jgi:hypothetical protein